MLKIFLRVGEKPGGAPRETWENGRNFPTPVPDHCGGRPTQQTQGTGGTTGPASQGPKGSPFDIARTNFKRVSLANAKPGDVVSMKTPGGHHVVMFAGWKNGKPPVPRLSGATRGRGGRSREASRDLDGRAVPGPTPAPPFSFAWRCVVPIRWFVLAVWLLQAACATTAPQGVPTRYAQSMNSAVDGCLRNPACVAASPGEEALIPWLSRAVSTAQALATLKEFLEEAELRLVEEILVECARDADFQVNEREYGPGKSPSDAECERVVGYKDGQPVKRAIELGVMKHELAFVCVERRLLTRFPDNISVEPRYGKNPSARGYSLTDNWSGSLKPDIVLHITRNPNKVQCVYDFKFPCTRASKGNPLSDSVRKQLDRYDDLGGNCPSAIVTPQLGINHD